MISRFEAKQSCKLQITIDGRKRLSRAYNAVRRQVKAEYGTVKAGYLPILEDARFYCPGGMAYKLLNFRSWADISHDSRAGVNRNINKISE